MRRERAKTTIRDLRGGGCNWVWIDCDACGHRAAATLAQFEIRFGPDASSDIIRDNARCGTCGHKGATLTHPSWTGMVAGYAGGPPAGSNT